MNFFKIRDFVSAIIWGRILSFFLKESGRGLRVVSPLKFINLRRISIGAKVRINSKGWIQVHDSRGKLEIGSGCVIGHFCHIYSFRSISIGDNVLIADKVYISDCLHEYTNIYLPIMAQQIRGLSDVNIGDNCWLGENVVVLGAKIGRHCTIGSNSVVTKDIPDYCVAVGIPAKIIKKYNHNTQKWEKHKHEE